MCAPSWERETPPWQPRQWPGQSCHGADCRQGHWGSRDPPLPGAPPGDLSRPGRAGHTPSHQPDRNGHSGPPQVPGLSSSAGPPPTSPLASAQRCSRGGPRWSGQGLPKESKAGISGPTPAHPQVRPGTPSPAPGAQPPGQALRPALVGCRATSGEGSTFSSKPNSQLAGSAL